VAHPFDTVELFLGSTVTETLRSLVSRYKIPEDHLRTFCVTALCLDATTILHNRNTRLLQRESLVSVTMQPWISDSPERRRPNFHTCYICQLHFPRFYYTEAEAFGEVKKQWRHTLKLLYTKHTHQNCAKCIDYELFLYLKAHQLSHCTPKEASCTIGTGSFPGVKRPGRGADHPLPRAIPLLPL
jgi:hypothetical protein